MTQAVIFETPGLIDMRALTTLGINVKPNTVNPIGYFGTGLKYAIAVLVRNDIPVTIYRGLEKYTFHHNEDTFRGEKVSMIEMRFKKNIRTRKTQLPYTTQFGKNWELWQAFRELYSNTIDEQGNVTHTVELSNDIISVEPEENMTNIIIEGGDFAREYIEREKTFLPEALMCKTEEHPGSIQYFLKPSKHIYYRGMRVMDLPKPSVFTYNLLAELELTEDRTAKHAWVVEERIRDLIISATDPKLIEAVLEAPTSSYEYRFDYDNFVYTSPSAEFSSTANKLHVADRLSSSSAKTLVDRYDEDRVIISKYPWLVDLMADHSQHGDWEIFHAALEEHENDVTEILKAAAALIIN